MSSPLLSESSKTSTLSWQVCPVLVRANEPLGGIVLIRLHLEARTGYPNLDWHCSRVEVREVEDGRAEEGGTEPEGPEVQVFLCDRWLRTADGDVELRSGKCKTSLSERDPAHWTFTLLSINVSSIEFFISPPAVCLLKDETDEKLKQQRLKQLQHQQKLIR